MTDYISSLFVLPYILIFLQWPTYSEVINPTVNISTPLRETMKDAHEGVKLNIQYLDFQEEYMLSKFKDFEDLTKAKINPIRITQANWFSQIEEDINGAGFLDLYAVFGNWIPTFVEKNGLLDVTEDVGNAVGLDWFDIMPAVRQGVASYKGRVWTVPLDGDVIVMLYREDLVEGRGLKTPRSWDDVLEIIDYYNKPENADVNGDGIPDYTNCFSSAENDIGGTMFWSIASSFLQTKGTAQGTFFHPETFDPISAADPVTFEEVLRVYNILVQNSPFRDLGPTNWQDNMAVFQEGRCVLWYNYPGPTRLIISNQNTTNMTGVLNYAPLPGMACKGGDERIKCPYVSDDGASHAPFLASGGFSYVVNARSNPKKQKAALDFSFYISDPAVGYWDVAYTSSFLDPLRRRHTVSLSSNDTVVSLAFLENGWEERQLPQLQEVTDFNFLHDNYVLDLRILGANIYQEQGTMPHLIKMWKGEWNSQQTAEAITSSWRATTDKFGLEEQRKMYRETLGLAPYIESASSTTPWNIIIPVIVCVSIIIIGLVLLVLKQQHTIKYKTRDVNNAPREGQVAIIFTDIEGSTALWDASKTVMSHALEVHHHVIRKCIDEVKAYEVKTIGDAFMIAVPSADKAVQLANKIQVALLEADWPIELANMPTACSEFSMPSKRGEVARPIFRGLRCRIGIHVGTHSKSVEEGGQIQVKYDKVTKGYDYYGPATNVAARIEALGFGGQTLISDDVVKCLSEEVKNECNLMTVGGFELKGVSREVKIHQCMPKELKGRTFRGVIRRRDSEGETVVPDDDSIMHLLESVNGDDLQLDVMTLTPIQLQNLVVRLRKKISLVHELMLDDNVKNSINDRLSVISTNDQKYFDVRLSNITTGDESLDDIGDDSLDDSIIQEEKKGQ